MSKKSINKEPSVLVLLSTYNGIVYLKEQLDSVLTQLEPCDRVVIRDDGSTDGTLELLTEYKQIDPDRIEIFPADGLRLGPAQSFGIIIQQVVTKAVSAGDPLPYIILCDQDDVWLPSKRHLFVNALQAAERKKPNRPVLVHSDLKVVDADLSIVADSLWSYQGLKPDRKLLRDILLSNTVTGCACGFNIALAKAILPIPGKCIMHDWWLALVASRFGEVITLLEPTVLYRQHGQNTIGAVPLAKRPHFLIRILNTIIGGNTNQFHAVAEQAKAFRERFESQLSVSELSFLQQLQFALTSHPIIARLWLRAVKNNLVNR